HNSYPTHSSNHHPKPPSILNNGQLIPGLHGAYSFRLHSQFRSLAWLHVGHASAIYLLNIVSRESTRVAMHGRAPIGRYGHAVTMVGTKTFIFGGQYGQQQLGSCVNLSEPPVLPNAGHACVTYQVRIIVFGGTDDQYHYNDTWSYDTDTRTWSELQCIGFIPSPREGHAAAVVDDVIYIFGGRGIDGKDLSELAAFKMSTYRVQTSGGTCSNIWVQRLAAVRPTRSTVPNGTRAMSPTGHSSPQDVDDLRRAISTPGIQPGNRTLNNAPAQLSPNTKGKAPARLRRDDSGELFGTDDGNGTDTGATIESITTSRDHAPSPDQTPVRSPNSFSVVTRAMFPASQSGSDQYGNVQPPKVASMAMSGLGARSPSPVISRSKPPLDALYQPSGGSPGLNGNGNGYVQGKFDSTGNVTADLI
ncbi:galactose oxidase, partial [Suillus brevipes Sb2]